MILKTPRYERSVCFLQGRDGTDATPIYDKKKTKSNSRKVKDPKMSQLCRRKVKNLWRKNRQKQKQNTVIV